MSNLDVVILQTVLHWEDPEANLKHFESLLLSLDPADLVVLPEMFTTGFTMVPGPIAEDATQGAGVQWLQNMASKLDMALCGSIAVKDNGQYYNRFYFAHSDGTLDYYNKRHLFRMAGEDKAYTAGEDRVIVNFRGWRINLQVCYDLRFPVWSRNRGDYDCMIYPANWPAVRRKPWMTLLKARAIENQVYVLGANRIGTDGNGVDYSGDSLILDAKGESLSELEPNADGVLRARLSMTDLEAFREKFPVALDADEFTV